LGHIQAVVMANTHELAHQICEVAKELNKFKRVKVVSLQGGGRTVKEDLKKLEEENHLAICTTGRLKDLLSKKKNLLDQCEFFVLDEADRILKDTRTEEDIEGIISYLPKQCGLYLYSATFPVRIRGFKHKYMANAVVVNMMNELMLLGLTHYYILVNESEKLLYLFKIYQELIINQCIIFCGSSKRAEYLSKKMKNKNLENELLISNMKEERIKVFERFRKGEFRTLISSDLVSRGLDVPNVNVVINFDFPGDASTYLHRVGRSGRYGQIGLAINLITDTDQENVIKIEK
jgi:ATP-dependent RNA helicase DDX6/DHH1